MRVHNPCVAVYPVSALNPNPLCCCGWITFCTSHTHGRGRDRGATRAVGVTHWQAGARAGVREPVRQDLEQRVYAQHARVRRALRRQAQHAVRCRTGVSDRI